MEVISPSVAETQLTGYIGSVARNVRSVRYEVRLTVQAGGICGQPLRNGRPIDWSPLTRKLAKDGMRFFSGTEG